MIKIYPLKSVEMFIKGGSDGEEAVALRALQVSWDLENLTNLKTCFLFGNVLIFNSLLYLV